MSGDGLALRGVPIRGLDDVLRVAETLARAKSLVPRHYNSDPAAIASAIMAGLELGLGVMESIRSIDMIEGKPCIQATCMLSLALRRGVRYRWIESTHQRATIEIVRDGETLGRLTYSTDDAKRADLLGKKNWRCFPDAMLRARASSAAIRMYCPDVLGAGVYTVEEIDADRDVAEERAPLDRASAIETTTAPVEAAPALPAERPVRLEDITDADAVLAWCRANRDRLAPLEGARRARAHAAVEAAAVRTGLDDMTALEAAGLVVAPDSND